MKLTLKLILLSALFASVSAANQEDSLKRIKLLSSLLEKNAKGEKAADEITMELVYGASDDYAKLAQDEKERLDRYKAERMVVDLALIPAKLIRGYLKFDGEAERMFIGRLLRTYNELRPAYHGKRIGSPIFVAKHPKCEKLVKAALNNEGAATLVDFFAAKREFENYVKRVEQMRGDDDIYSELAELREIFNFFNEKPVGILRSKILKTLKQESDAKELMAQFRTELKAARYEIAEAGGAQ